MRILVVCSVLLLGCVLGVSAVWAQSLAANEVEQALDMRLRVALEEAGTGMQIVAIQHRTGLRLPDGVISWRMTTNVATLEPGPVTLPISVLVNGRSVAETSVAVTLRQQVQTPVLRHHLKRGAVVASDDVQMQDVVLTKPLPGRIRELQKVIGLVATQSLQEGQPLIDKWFEQPLAINRGDRVRIQLVRGSLRIDTAGTAMQRGRVGDTIQIRNPQSKMQYEALITAPGEARVQAW